MAVIYYNFSSADQTLVGSVAFNQSAVEDQQVTIAEGLTIAFTLNGESFTQASDPRAVLFTTETGEINDFGVGLQFVTPNFTINSDSFVIGDIAQVITYTPAPVLNFGFISANQDLVGSVSYNQNAALDQQVTVAEGLTVSFTYKGETFTQDSDLQAVLFTDELGQISDLGLGLQFLTTNFTIAGDNLIDSVTDTVQTVAYAPSRTISYSFANADRTLEGRVSYFLNAIADQQVTTAEGLTISGTYKGQAFSQISDLSAVLLTDQSGQIEDFGLGLQFVTPSFTINGENFVDAITNEVQTVTYSSSQPISYSFSNADRTLTGKVSFFLGAAADQLVTVAEGLKISGTFNGRTFTEASDPEAVLFISQSGEIGELGLGLQFVTPRFTINGENFIDANSTQTIAYGIAGTDGDDKIFAAVTTSNETFLGLDGNDVIDTLAGAGNNTLFGGNGDDELFAFSNDQAFGGNGNDTLYSDGEGSNRLFGGDDNDTIFSDRNDAVFGDAGDDTIFGGTSNNKLTGGAGKDTFYLTPNGVPENPNQILDFSSDEDTILITAIPEVESFRSLIFEQTGDDTTISANIAGTLRTLGILRNIQANTVSSNDLGFTTTSTFSVRNASAAEGLAIAFTIIRTGNTETAQAVTVSTDVVLSNDFTFKSETLTFAIGETEKTFTVATIADDLIEPDETFRVTLGNPTNGAIISAANGAATGTIINDDLLISNLTTPNIFNIKGTQARVRLGVSLSDRNSSSVNELGVILVDDAQGRINGIAPGAATYNQEAFNRVRTQGNVVFSAIANIPNGFNTTNLSSLLEFNSGDNLRFYLVRNSTTDAVRSGATTIANVLISDATNSTITGSGNPFTLSFRDGSRSVTEFNDLVVNVQSTDNPLDLGTALQNLPQGEVIDLRRIITPGSFTTTQRNFAEFIVNREAAFDNYVGFYRATDANGGIDTNGDGVADLVPGQTGYIQAIARGRVGGIDLAVTDQGTATFSGVFQGGGIFVPFMVVNGRPDALLDADTTNDPALFTPFLAANSDGVDHVRRLGNNVFGFEDLVGGGDNDFNDVIVRVNLTPPSS